VGFFKNAKIPKGEALCIGGGGGEWALSPGGFSKINEILTIARDFAQIGKWAHPLSSLSILRNVTD